MTVGGGQIYSGASLFTPERLNVARVCCQRNLVVQEPEKRSQPA